MKKKVKYFDCLKKFLFQEKWKYKNIIWVHRKRNAVKIIKVFINWKSKGYLELDKLNRNIYIDTKTSEDVILSTDY